MGCYRDCIAMCQQFSDTPTKHLCMSGCGSACHGLGVTEGGEDLEPVLLSENVSGQVSNSLVEASSTCFKDCIAFCQALETPDHVSACIQGCGSTCAPMTFTPVL